jgi:hypothetical protein
MKNGRAGGPPKANQGNSARLKKIQARIRIATAAYLVLLVATMAQADEDSPGKLAGDRKEVPRFLIELKREATNRGTPEETTKSQIKIDALLDGVLSLLRLEVPFPDDKTSFEGDPFSPRLGDIKVRVGFRPVRIDEIPIGSSLEVTFPTADPKELGSGKYQVSPGIRTNFPISSDQWLPESHKMSFEPLVKQVFSVAGDENRKNINYTKFELSLRDTWRKKFWLKLTPKPVVDWEQSAQTGAVAELEGGWIINSSWRVWLMLGTRLWGEGVPSTYDKRVGLNASLTF